MKNEGQLEKVLIQNHHDAIISVENFQRTQELKIERSKAPTQEIGTTMSINKKAITYLDYMV